MLLNVIKCLMPTTCVFVDKFYVFQTSNVSSLFLLVDRHKSIKTRWYSDKVIWKRIKIPQNWYICTVVVIFLKDVPKTVSTVKPFCVYCEFIVHLYSIIDRSTMFYNFIQEYMDRFVLEWFCSLAVKSIFMPVWSDKYIFPCLF